MMRDGVAEPNLPLLGVSQVPFGCCVEIEMVVDVCPSDSAVRCKKH
jgi:hypothetical protein